MIVQRSIDTKLKIIELDHPNIQGTFYWARDYHRSYVASSDKLPNYSSQI